mgnify:CR=1 FL=1
MLRMAATRTGQNKLKQWEHPAKSGIWIAEVLNRSGGESFGVSYKVTLPAKLAGTRQRKQFGTQALAEEFATSEQDRLRRQGQEGLSLTPAQRREVATALERLAPAGIGILEAVEFALRHMRPEGGDRTVKEVVDEMVAMKKGWLATGELRPSSFRDFKQRAERFADYFGSAQVKSVTLPEVKTWLRSLGLSGRSVKNYRMTASEIMRHSHTKKYRADNPLDEFSKSDRRELEPGGENFREPAMRSVC